MAKKLWSKLSKKRLAAIHDGLKEAGLGGYKISSLHLKPKRRAVGAAAADADGPCHSEQLPNGHWIIVCD